MTDAGADVLKMLPFLFAAFLVIEALESNSTGGIHKLMQKAGGAGPVAGAVLGCIPQCGFSVMAANLYAGGIISPGTLLSVFIATSDEAVLIMLGNPGQGRKILALFAAKILIAVGAGYISDFFLKKYITVPENKRKPRAACGCNEHEEGIFMPAVRHSVKIFFYLFVFTAALNLCIQLLGMERLSEYFLSDTWLQPVISAMIGLIPNCAASVVLAQLYLRNVISFASVVAGLCTGAGAGLVVLFKMNRSRRENCRIVLLLYGIGVLAGMLLEFIG